MCNNRYQNCGSCGCDCGCPFDRLQELNRMCGCASGVIADVISSCDSFCHANVNGNCGCRSCSCGNRNRCCGD